MTQLIITILLVAAILINQYQISVLMKEIEELKAYRTIDNIIKDADEREMW